MLELPGVQDRPALFSTFLMWLLADLFHDLPEVGDLDKPKLVFFFDEAHLLFNDASKAFLDADRADRAADPLQGRRRLLRDPDAQGRARRRAGPARQPGAARAARLHPERRQGAQGDRAHLPEHRATTSRSCSTQLGIGEAVVTVLSEKGAPTPVAWTRMRAPQSLMAPSDAALLTSTVAASPIAAKYGTYVERESASEMLGKAEVARTEAEQAAAVEAENAKVRAAAEAAAEKERVAAETAAEKARVAAEKQAAKDAAAAQKAQEAAGPQAGGRAEHGRGGREVERLQVGAALGGHGARPRDHPLDLRHLPQALTPRRAGRDASEGAALVGSPLQHHGLVSRVATGNRSATR